MWEIRLPGTLVPPVDDMGIFSYLAVPNASPQMEFRFFYFTDRYDATVAFYRDDLGLDIYNSWNRGPMEKGTIFRFPETSGLIEIEEGKDAPVLGGGLYIEVTDVDEWHRKLSRKGITVSGEPEIRSYGHTDFSFTDPSGLHVMLFQKNV